MEDPLYETTVTVGGKSSSYFYDAFPKQLHSNQSFILQHTYQKPDNTAYDIDSAVATLYVSAYNNSDYTPIALASGVLSDSGSGTTDRVTFTVPKDLIPTDLGSFPQRKPGNSVFYIILEDADSILEFSEQVNVIDPSYGLQGNTDPSSSAIVTQRNDLGTVESVTETTPPAPTLNLAYIVGVGATGDWAGQDNNLAVGNGSNWIFTLAEEGNFVFAKDVDEQRIYNGTAWAANASSGLPVADTTSIVSGNVDATKLLRFDVETNVPTATTIVATVPSTDITLGTDADAIHDNVAGEIDAITEKGTPVSGDLLIIEDSADSNNKKKVQIGNLPAGASALDDLTDVNLTGVAQGDLLYRNASEWVNLGPGTSGQFLKTNGAAANPSWDSPAGSGDVVGPGSAVDDNLCSFDSTTGKLIQDSGVSTADVVANNAKVTNATHTGEVTGATTLTVDSTAITNKTTVTAATGDFLLLSDTSDSGNLKKVDANDFLSGGGLPTGNVSIGTTGTVDVDWSLGDTFEVGTLTGNLTLTFSNVSQGQTITIDVTGASGFTFDLPSSCDVALEGTDFTADVRNLVHIKAIDGATSQEYVYNLTTSSSTSSVQKVFIKDVKAFNVGGGNSTAATHEVRDLNDTSGETSLVSLSSNRFTPVANDYYITASSPMYNVQECFIYLYNFTQSTTEIVGSSLFASVNSTDNALINGEFTANGTDEYEIIMYTKIATTNGLGRPHGISGYDNVYTQVTLEVK